MPLNRFLPAVFIAIATWLVYLRTMYPGLVGGDSAKFQFLGTVLGTAHPPGYPAYVLISSVFGQIPVGTLAFRINLMSVFFGIAAVLLVYAILVRIGCHRVVASAAALCLAFDRYLWGKSLVAEVYSLNGALVALTVWLALRWHTSGKKRDLYLAAGAFALSLGNHLTALMIGPALVLFVVLTAPSAVTVRTVLVSAAIVLGGAAQYLFIMLRTYQRAEFLEARATGLTELFNVMRASRYQRDIMAFTGEELVAERLPAVWRLFQIELNPIGLALFGIGLVFAVWRRESGVLLATGAMLGITALTLNVAADSQGFMVAACVMMWVIAGYGMHVCWATSSRAGRAAVAVAAIALAALPAWQVVRNYRVNDHSGRTHEIRLFGALFDRLEDRAAIISEDYFNDMSVRYKLLGERASRGRTIRIVQANPQVVQKEASEGTAIYAFAKAQKALDGFGLRFEPVQLHEQVEEHGRTETRLLDMKTFTVFRLADWATCETVGNVGWRDVSALARAGAAVVRIDNYRPFPSAITAYSVGTAPPGLLLSRGSGTPEATVKTFNTRTSADRSALLQALERDAVPGADGLVEEPLVHRISVSVNDEGNYSQSLLSLGVAGGRVLLRATVDRDLPRRATVCGWAVPFLLAQETRQTISFGPSATPIFGARWLAPAEGNAYRWINGESADLAVPIARTGPIRVRVRAAARDYRPRELSIRVNGRPMSGQPFQHDWTTYEWTVPDGTFYRGVNRLTVAISGRVGRNVAVEYVDFELLPPDRRS